jgi:GntR family transcriptional regulator
LQFSKNQSIYTQISDYVCASILNNSWEELGKIPSIREMAISLEVNPNTVSRAYTSLEKEGIIETKRGLGYFVKPNAKDKILTIKKEQFLKEELPIIFKSMQTLDINIEDFAKLYQQRNKND